jgi:outer membrane protein assembly factor BamD (BamD/ComL family)
MVSLDQVDQAIMSLEDVLAGSKAYPSLRAEASLELGKALKKRDAMRSASIFLEFYYRYPKHEKAQEALYESCRLKAMNLDQVAKAQRDQKVIELKRLVSKIERERERESLMTYLASIEL